MKKVLTFMGLLGVLALSTISFTSAYTQEQIEAYQWAYKHKITTQPTIDKAKMNSPLTRQAFAKMVVNYLENVVGVKQSVTNSCYFPDENKITDDLKPYTKKTCAYQIMGSNGKSFNPTQPVDRAQLGTVISRILWGDKYNNSGKWYYINHLNKLKENGIMNKIDNPGAYAKRGDVLVMLKRLYEKFGSNISINGGSVSIGSLIDTSANSSSNVSNNTPVVRKTDSNGFSYYDSYLDNPPLSKAMKDMKLRSTSCENIFCQQVGDDGTYSNQKHYYWNDEKGTMTLIPGVYFVGDCAYYDNIYGSKKNSSSNNTSSSSYDYYEDDDYLSSLYSEQVVYIGEDGTKYYYDIEFLKMLKEWAGKKGESDLSDYLKVQIAFYENIEEFEKLLDDEEELEKITGIAKEDNFQQWSQEEKNKAISKANDYIKSLETQYEKNSQKYVKDLNNVVKNIKTDKFGLKENYKKTEEYIKSYTKALSVFLGSLADLLATQTQPEEKQSDEEVMATMFGLLGMSINLESIESKYNSYQQEWAINTIKLLGGKVNSIDNVGKSENSNSSQDYSNPEVRVRDVDRKNHLSQIQTAIITSQGDNGKWPGMDKGATKGIPVSTIEKELLYVGMSRIPSDPIGNKKVSGLGTLNVADGGYAYLVTKRNSVDNAGFVLMAKMELASTSNWVVCKNKSGLDNGYITTDTDLANIRICKKLTKGDSCSATACTYTDDDELRYIVIY